jgi:hypothetical protein
MLRSEIGLRRGTVTTDLKVKSLIAAVVAVLAVTLPTGARAANLAAEFSGFWIAAATSGNQCRKDDIKDEKNDIAIDRVMGVGPGTVTFYETNCKLTSVRPPPKLNNSDRSEVNARAELACSGEGSSWQASEIWHVETIDKKKVAVATALKQSNYRDERGRKQNTPSLVMTSIYFECE